ncbi:MAG: phage tail tape measure protein [Clostridiaceae bacterium]|nr:phage tail tape measure protein [Clostridiaceae bacterium]
MESLFQLAVVISAIDQLSGPVGKMTKSITDLEKTAGKAQKMVDFGKEMTVSGALVTGAADKINGATRSLLGPTAEVQDAMAQLETVITPALGSVEDAMDSVRKSAVDWSKQHTDSAADFVKTSYMMSSAGLNEVQAIEGTKTAMTVATATMGDHIEAANLLATVYNNMGDKTNDVQSEMGRLGDVITKTQQTFQFANLNQLTEGLKYAMPAAIDMGIAVEDLNTIVGQLNNAGLQGSQAGTAFAATMRQMAKASKDLGFEIERTSDGGIDFIGTLENITSQYGDISELSDDVYMEFQKAFGAEGLRAISLLSGKTDEMRQNLDAVTNSTGAAAEAQKTLEATGSKQWEILQNNIDAAKMSIGNHLLPVINDAIPKIKGLVESFGEFVERNPGLFRTLVILMAISGAALAVIGPVMMMVGSFAMMSGYGIKGIVSLTKGFLKFKKLLTSGKMLASIKSIGASTFQMAKTFIMFGKQAAIQAVVGLKNMTISLIAMAKQAIITAVTALPGLIASVWAFTTALLANPVTWIIIGIVALGAAIYALWKNWDVVSEWLSGAWSRTTELVGVGIDYLVAGFWRMIDFLRSLPGLFFEAAQGIWNAFIDGIRMIISVPAGLMKDALELMRAAPGEMLGVFKNAGQGLWNAFTDGIRSVINKPVDLVKSGLSKVRKLLPFSDAKEGPLSTLTKSGSAFIETFNLGMIKELPNLKKTFSTGLEGLMDQGDPKPKTDPPDFDFPGDDGGGFDFPPFSGNGGGGQPSIIIHGDVILKVERVDDPEDLVGALRRFAEEMA